MKTKNRFLLFLSLVGVTLPLSSCGRKNVLLLLNWGEYINQDLVEAFEDEYNCIVKESITESNELFYSKLKSGTTVYDLVVPSDYMVKKMYENDLIQPIFKEGQDPKEIIPNYDRSRFLPGVNGIIDYFGNNKDPNVRFEDFWRYQIPYFWGSWGLMYNKKVDGLGEALNEYGWDAFFDNKGMPTGVRKGMYNVPRDAYAASMFHHNLSPNVQNNEYIDLMEEDLRNAKFEQWGTDDLKKQIQKGDLDVAYMWTGDFLDMYYSDVADDKPITYDIYIPDQTIAFMDSIVITKKAIHLDLAYKFINFFLRTEVAQENASIVGYCTTLQESYDNIVNLKDSDDSSDVAWSYCYENYYPLPESLEGPQFKGTPLLSFDKNFITNVTNVVNDVKSTKK